MSAETRITVDPLQPTIHIAREFDAPRHLVFEAMSKPEFIARWWGPLGTTLTTCEMDFRVGGRWRFVLRGPNGAESGFGGVYREIVAPQRIVQTFVFDPFPDAEAVETMSLTEHNGRTRYEVLVVHKNLTYRDGHVNAGMEGGLRQTLDRLEGVVLTLVEESRAASR